jgi:DNA-binding PadR family transcriptional regulator
LGAEPVTAHRVGVVRAVGACAPAQGYAVISALRARSDGEFDLPEGTVYPALHRLEKAGLLSSSWSDDAPRRRRVYAITAAGQRSLGERRARWRGFTSAVDAVMGDPA